MHAETMVLGNNITIIPVAEIIQDRFPELLSFYNQNFPSSSWSSAYATSFFENKELSPMGFVIMADDRFIGFVCGRLSKTRPGYFNISTLIISPAFRGKGLAGILMKRIMRSAKKIPELKGLQLHFRKKNDLGPLYSKFGFTNIREDGKYKNGETKMLMDFDL